MQNYEIHQPKIISTLKQNLTAPSWIKNWEDTS